MQTTSWFDYIQADQDTRLKIDRQGQAHREQIAALREQQAAIWAVAGIGIEQVRGLSAVASGVAGVRDDLAALSALFDWRLEQILVQQREQTRRLDDLTSILSNPLDTQGQELWRRAQFAAERDWIDEAIVMYNAAIEKSPFLYPAHLQLGFIQAYQQFDFAAATRSFTLAARYAERDDPKSSAVAEFQLHKFARESGDRVGAKAHLHRACFLDASVGSSWWDSATLARDTAEWNDIVPSLTKAIEIDALYWHRARQESWGNAQEAVTALLAEKDTAMKHRGSRLAAGLDSWKNGFETYVSEMPQQMQSAFVAAVDGLRTRLADLKGANTSNDFAIVAAGVVSTQKLAESSDASMAWEADVQFMLAQGAVSNAREHLEQLIQEKTRVVEEAKEKDKSVSFDSGCTTTIVAVIAAIVVLIMFAINTSAGVVGLIISIVIILALRNNIQSGKVDHLKIEKEYNKRLLTTQEELTALENQFKLVQANYPVTGIKQ